MEQSGLKEVGNILSSAYLNALSDFMGMMLVPSVPSLVIDLCGAVLTSTYLNFGYAARLRVLRRNRVPARGSHHHTSPATSCCCRTWRRSGSSSTPSA